VYGEKDEADLSAIANLGIPFWLAGSRGSAQGLADALSVGAAGVQVGTAFALCEESGLTQKLKDQILTKVLDDQLDVFTDPHASPTGFPFKLARLEGTNSEDLVYNARKRRCDLGYLRESFKKADGSIGYRCPAEPVDQFVQKGGSVEQTVGRKCLCNGLLANIGLPQIVDSSEEKSLVTIGDDIKNIGQFIKGNNRRFTAQDVISVLLS
jgi:nitronate monooxygenase